MRKTGDGNRREREETAGGGARDAVLALDIGTTRTKAAIYHGTLRRGPVRSVSTRGIDRDGTFDLDAIVGTVLDLLRETVRETAQAQPDPRYEPIRAIGVTSFLSHILIDYEGRIVPPGLSWSYRPAPETLATCRRACAAVRYRPERPVGAELLAPRLLDLAGKDAELSRSIARVVSIKDVVREVLAGRYRKDSLDITRLSTDYSVRDYSFIRDRLDRPILPVLRLLERAGYRNPSELVPPVYPAHHPVDYLDPGLAEKLGLPREIPIVMGATDGTTAMYGAGVLAERRITLVFGTTDVAMRAVPASRQDEQEKTDLESAVPGQSRNASPVPGCEVIGGSTSASGPAIPWLQGVLRDTDRWESIEPGSGGVLVAPGFSGERAPWDQPDLRGAIHGLTPDHTGAHWFRAVLEAQTYRVRWLIELLMSGEEFDGNKRDTGTEPQFTVLAGGGNRSPGLDALRAAVLPFPVRWRRDEELSLCGAAIFAFSGTAETENRDTTLRALCRLAAEDTEDAADAERAANAEHATDAEPVITSNKKTRRYDELYREWKRWIHTLYEGDD